ncbi:hypothetical protein K431DRAFT_8911 [Polychaeton citri CBS 116435]|uniref:Uncharacterized protein n=1 Tax=Polychaeton citri CBS 116435 TaxID=1314669 RepID=A0A9P4QCW4_9PEZI|nr:hypothetical protein K431DRAFT_8911 [Polychaeton citri CBS 116435]
MIPETLQRNLAGLVCNSSLTIWFFVSRTSQAAYASTHTKFYFLLDLILLLILPSLVSHSILLASVFRIAAYSGLTLSNILTRSIRYQTTHLTRGL